MTSDVSNFDMNLMVLWRAPGFDGSTSVEPPRVDELYAPVTHGRTIL